MCETVLEFLPNQAGESEGLGDAGIETFRDNPYASCARESGQNSADAATNRPVRMTFDVIDVPTNQFPGYSVLKDTVDKCLIAAKQEKEIDFLSQAKELLSRPTIKVLRISDFNTTGLSGPSSVDGTPFHSLLKGAGISNNKSETSGGSFGIGKNASFAISDLQTVFYSTVYKNSAGNLQFSAQGKCRLISHQDKNGVKRRATGYWGKAEGYVAVEERDQVPNWMQRTEIGTSIFSAGFRQNGGWTWSIAYSLLTNFFAAIYRKQMAFEIDNGAIKVNHNTIAALFRDERIRDAAEADGQSNLLEFSRDLYRCLTSSETKEVEIPIQGFGKMNLRILVADDMPRRVGIVRNGMLITSELQNFGDKLQRFTGSREFIAYVEPFDNDVSKLMKSIENPRHDSFSANRLSDPTKRQRAENSMKQFIKDLRFQIVQSAAIEQEDEVTLDELAPFFADGASAPNPPNHGTENDPEKYLYKPARKTNSSPTRPKENSGFDGGGAGTKETEEKGGKRFGDKKGFGDGTDSKGSQGKTTPIKLHELRTAIPKSDLGATRRIVWFTPTVSGSATVNINATGLNAGEPLKMTSSSEGKVSNGNLSIELIDGIRVAIEVSFDSAYSGPIEVFATSA